MEYRSVLILGAGGCLGGYAVSCFKEAGWKVCSITTSKQLETADLSLVLQKDRSTKEQVPEIISEIQKVTQSFEAIVCVAGGFECSNISDVAVFDDLQ